VFVIISPKHTIKENIYDITIVLYNILFLVSLQQKIPKKKNSRMY
jgi:hypothetical protein